ncbi:MAG: NADPH-dependent 7-cyano-7-deazaguanine reductase QueF [Bermanella sp.]
MSSSMNNDDLLLGKATQYVSNYDQSLLFPIARSANRARLNLPVNKAKGERPFFGEDVWTGYELSWLNLKGKPQVAIAEFLIPADSTNIVESKSFKLYLNSFNNTRIASSEEVTRLLLQDLSAGFGAQIEVNLCAVDAFPLAQAELGDNIDELDIEVQDFAPNAALLKVSDHVVSQTLNSHLLKSNCPVTSQPDWATLVVQYTGSEIDPAALLKYIISYRNHDDFHEHCVEQIFCDLCQVGDFSELIVSARYTRRGGLDINPTRSLKPLVAGNRVGRLARQ